MHKGTVRTVSSRSGVFFTKFLVCDKKVDATMSPTITTMARLSERFVYIMPGMKTRLVLLILGLVLAACSGESPTMQSKSSSPASASLDPARPPDENAALAEIRQTNNAQTTYFKVNRRYALTYDELIESRLLKSAPSAQTGYDFKLRPAADAQTYRLSVVPSASGAATARQFFSDQTGIIRAATGKEATPDSAEVK
jgi:hypothetical protein